jgi:hypothetical protein
MTTMKIKEYADVFPEASFIITHRDPFRALVSSCVTGDAICEAFLQTPPGPLHEDGLRGQEAFGLQRLVLNSLVKFAKSEPSRVVNVRYADLMSNAVATTRSTYDCLKMSVPEKCEERIVRYLREQRSGRRAAPPRSLETFGYRADTVWRDPAVTEYCELFGIERELCRMVDTRTES